MKKLFAALIVIGVLTVSELLAGPPSPPPPPAGTAAEIAAGTETATRVWAPKTLADEFSGATAEVQNEAVSTANFNGDTTHAAAQDDLENYFLLFDTGLDGDIDNLDAALSWSPTGTLDFSGATVTFGLATSDLPTTGDWTISSGTWDLGSLTSLTIPGLKNGSTSAGFLRLYEDSDDGTDYTDLIGATGLSGNITLTLPNDNGGILQTEDTTAAFTNKTLTGSGNVHPVCVGIAASDESTALTTGTAKVTFRVPHAMTVTAVRANVNTAPTGATINVDINEGGVSILSTVITIDASEETSTTAATPPVISDSALADDAEITIDIDQIGSGTAGAGLKVWLIGTRTM